MGFKFNLSLNKIALIILGVITFTQVSGQIFKFDTIVLSKSTYQLIEKYDSISIRMIIEINKKKTNESSIVVYEKNRDSLGNQYISTIFNGNIEFDSVNNIICTGKKMKYGVFKNKSVLIEKGFIVKNLANGVFKGYNYLKIPVYEETYKCGVLNGKYKYFHDDGKLREEGNYVEDNKMGMSYEYYKSGNLKAKGEFKGNCSDAIVHYDKHGNASIEYPFLECEKKGLWRYYGENGKLTKTEYFE